MKRTMFLMPLVALLLLAGSALAMESDNYKLDWFTPLTGSGGAASSAGYAVNFTVGQSAIGTPSGASYGACLGYWCADGLAIAPGPGNYDIYLPLVLR